MKVQDRQNCPSKSFRAYQKKLAGYAPDHYLGCVITVLKYLQSAINYSDVFHCESFLKKIVDIVNIISHCHLLANRFSASLCRVI